MNYAQIRKIDTSNGEGVGVSLFVSGCDFGCKNCFNKDLWSYTYGKSWDFDAKRRFLDLASKSYISRISILGGDPLMKRNLADIANLVNEIRLSFPEKKIWLYSGYTWEEIFDSSQTDNLARQEILKSVDVLVDGRYEHDKRDLSLKFRGSSNQRVIDVQESLKNHCVVNYCD